MNRRIIATLGSFLFIVIGTVIAIRWTQGYRPTRDGQVRATGLLSANSFPTGASVYINGNLTSATDTTLNLSPGEYEVEIRKEGYFPWKKKLQLERELVTQTNALLLPTASGLSPLTYIGAEHVHPSPDGQKLLFTTASASAARNNGVYVLDMTDNPLALQKGPRQIARNADGWDFDKASFLWSPEGDQILVSLGNRNILLDPSRFTDVENIKDISVNIAEILSAWEEQLAKREQSQREKFPEEILRIATESGKNIFISPDQEKMIYTATASASLPDHIIPPLPASNSQLEERELQPGNIYIYDRREDKNFLVSENTKSTDVENAIPLALSPKNRTQSPSPGITPEFTKLQEKNDIQATFENFTRHYSGLYTSSPQWLPDSRHVILRQDNTISIVEYDGTNKTQVYTGPLSYNFVYPWPNGSKLVILTNFNQADNVPLNLYALSLR